MAAYLLNVILALHPENVPIACGRNVVAGGFLSDDDDGFNRIVWCLDGIMLVEKEDAISLSGR